MADIKGNILKVRLGNDTRRQMLYNTNISYNDLVLMLQRIYSGKLKPSDDITLKYFDEGESAIHRALWRSVAVATGTSSILQLTLLYYYYYYYLLYFLYLDGDLITIADDGDFAHAREYSQTGVVSMIIYGNLNILHVQTPANIRTYTCNSSS